jgi:hypothetical protein
LGAATGIVVDVKNLAEFDCPPIPSLLGRAMTVDQHSVVIEE